MKEKSIIIDYKEYLSLIEKVEKAHKLLFETKELVPKEIQEEIDNLGRNLEWWL